MSGLVVKEFALSAEQLRRYADQIGEGETFNVCVSSTGSVFIWAEDDRGKKKHLMHVVAIGDEKVAKSLYADVSEEDAELIVKGAGGKAPDLSQLTEKERRDVYAKNIAKVSADKPEAQWERDKRNRRNAELKHLEERLRLLAVECFIAGIPPAAVTDWVEHEAQK